MLRSWTVTSSPPAVARKLPFAGFHAFLLGLAAGKTRLLARNATSRSQLIRITAAGLALGVPGAVFSAAASQGPGRADRRTAHTGGPLGADELSDTVRGHDRRGHGIPTLPVRTYGRGHGGGAGMPRVRRPTRRQHGVAPAIPPGPRRVAAPCAYPGATPRWSCPIMTSVPTGDSPAGITCRQDHGSRTAGNAYHRAPGRTAARSPREVMNSHLPYHEAPGLM